MQILLPHLCPGALRHGAELCGDSDIHRMQWIINEHHLVHTTGEHSSNRLLQDGFFYLSTQHYVSPCLTCFLILYFPVFPHTFIQLLSHCCRYRLFISISILIEGPLGAIPSEPSLLSMLLSGLSDFLVMVSLILIQWYNFQAANKATFQGHLFLRFIVPE